MIKNKSTQLRPDTHKLLLKVKEKMKQANDKFVQIDNDTIIYTALKRLDDGGNYGIKR